MFKRLQPTQPPFTLRLAMLDSGEIIWCEEVSGVCAEAAREASTAEQDDPPYEVRASGASMACMGS